MLRATDSQQQLQPHQAYRYFQAHPDSKKSLYPSHDDTCCKLFDTLCEEDDLETTSHLQLYFVRFVTETAGRHMSSAA